MGQFMLKSPAKCQREWFFFQILSQNYIEIHKSWLGSFWTAVLNVWPVIGLFVECVFAYVTSLTSNIILLVQIINDLQPIWYWISRHLISICVQSELCFQIQLAHSQLTIGLAYVWCWPLKPSIIWARPRKGGLFGYLGLLSFDEKKTGNRTGTPSWPDPYTYVISEFVGSIGWLSLVAPWSAFETVLLRPGEVTWFRRICKRRIIRG